MIFILSLLIQTQQYHSFATAKFYHYYLINSNPLLGISQLNPTLLIITHSAKRGSSLWDKVYPVPKIRQHLKHNIEEGNNSLVFSNLVFVSFIQANLGAIGAVKKNWIFNTANNTCASTFRGTTSL
jgi:hypothetical protein